jgi:hypothetical protein
MTCDNEIRWIGDLNDEEGRDPRSTIVGVLVQYSAAPSRLVETRLGEPPGQAVSNP